jgi:hypothetical protein
MNICCSVIYSYMRRLVLYAFCRALQTDLHSQAQLADVQQVGTAHASIFIER